MKKTISFILALLMIFGTAVNAFAATVKPVTDNTAVKAGENVSVKIELDQKIENIVQFEYSLYFDSNVFDLESSAVGTACPSAQISKVKNDKNGSYYSISFLDTASEGQTINAGTIFTLNFKAKENISEQKLASFRLEKVYLTDNNFSQIDDGNVESGEFTVTVSPADCDHVGTETETTYTAKGDGNHTVTVTCKKCGEAISTAEEACTRGTDGKCIHCGYVFPDTGEEYTITVNVAPSTVDVTFYGDEDGKNALAADKVIDKGVVDEKYHVYEITVPSGMYSYRAVDTEDDQDLGGMTFEAPVSAEIGADGKPIHNDQKMTLVRVNYYTTDSNVKAVGDYSIDIMPGKMKSVVTGAQYINDKSRVVTPTLLFAHGNALLYNWQVTLNEELSKTYGVALSINNTFSEGVNSTQNKLFTLSALADYTVTAPKGAAVRFFNQIKNFNVEELPVASTTENNDGTVTHTLRAPGGNLTYRVSMEGKITRAGYFDSNTNQNVTVTFAENENPKSTKNNVTSTVLAARIEASTMVNVNGQNNLSLGVGETFRLRAYRGAWQIINNDAGNIMIEPDFRYTVISGGEHIKMTPATNRCTGNAGVGEQTNWMDIEGVSEGLVVLEVKYDTIEIGGSTSYSGTYGATDPQRTSLIVINVGGDSSGLSMNAVGAENTWDTEYDTVYTLTDTATFSFNATLDEAEPTVQLSTDKGASWKNVSKNADGSFTAAGLVTGNNILKFTANGKTVYQVVRAAKVTYTIENVTSGGNAAYVGDDIRLVFHGLYQPIAKFSGIYNPGYGQGHKVSYNLSDNAEFKSASGGQYDFISTNKYTFTAKSAGNVVLSGGNVKFNVMGTDTPLGGHRILTDNGVSANFNAVSTDHVRDVLPEITVKVSEQGHEWGETTYIWSADNKTVTATHSCAQHPDETETETVDTVYSVVKPATCEAAGEGKWTATFTKFAAAEKTVVLPALEHKLVHHAAVEATCAAEGNIEYWECSVCGKLYSDKDAKNEVKTIVTAKDPKNHVGETELKNKKEATCGEEGYTGDTVCKGCGVVLEAGQVIPKTAHKWGAPAYEWSSDYKSVTAKVVCANDRTHTHTETVNTTAETKDATCTEKGKITYTAEFAANNEYKFTTQTKVVENKALDHDWGETVYKWSDDYKSCTATHTCKRDNRHSETETVDTVYSVVKEATCEAAGEGKWTATFTKFAAAEKTVVLPVLEHKLVHHAAVAATCAAEGNIEYWECSVCHKQFADEKGTEPVNTVVTAKNPENHVGETELKNKKEATCGEEGYTGDTVCKGCGVVLEAGQVIPKTAHKWGAPSYEWSSDYKSVTAKVVCANDSTHTHTETVNTTAETKDATCTEKGKITYTAEFAANNEYKFTTQTKVVENKALDHDWGETVYKWSDDYKSCTATHTCKRDNRHSETETVDTVYSVVKEATCEAAGEGKWTATFTKFAAAEKTVVLPVLEHKLVHHAAVAATCAAEGNIEYWECSVCHKQFADEKGTEPVNTVVTAKNPENHVGETELKNKKEATCGEEGYTGDTVCKGCGVVLEAGQVIPKTAHKWGAPAYEWSSDYKSVTAKVVCANDRTHELTQQAVVTSKTLKAATCTEKGSVEYTADFGINNNGFTKQTKVVETPALGHKLTHHDAVAATCVAEGSIEHWSCSVCGKLYSDKYAKNEVKTTVTAKDPKNHVGETEVKGYVEATCTKSGYTGDTYCKSCGDLIAKGKESPIVPHKFGAWIVTKQPTKSSAGEKVRYCEVCPYEQKMEIPRLSDGVVIHIGINDNKGEQNPETGAPAPSGIAAIAVVVAAAITLGKKRK